MNKARRRRREAVGLSILLAGMLLMLSPAAFALETSLDISQYAHTAWRVRDGFTKGTISAIAQTPDGYFWLGTEFGLLRFDGVRAVPWQPPPGQRLPSASIFSLLAARDGTLWIGTTKGVASWKDGKLTHYPELAGETIRAPILEDREGTIWVGGLAFPPPGKLCAMRKGSVQCYGEDGSLGNGVRGLYEDRAGNLWVGLREGIWHWKPGPPKFYSEMGPGNGIQGLAETDDGALLFGARTGIKRLVEGKIEPYPLPGSVRDFTAARLLRDRDGNLWIGTSDAGLVHLHGGRTDVLTQADGLSGDFITALLIDREGNIWVATDGGLDRFREFAVSTLSLNQGLSNASILSVLADRDGSVWLSTRRGLNRWNNGQITIFGDSRMNGLLNGNYAGSLFQDSLGRVWASTLREFGYLENGRFISVKNVPGGPVYSITEDHSGSLWIANKDLGLIHLLQSGEVQQTPWTRMGHEDYALALAIDPRRGLWAGFYRGGLTYFADDEVRASYSTADGLGEGRVNGLRFDPDGTLWAATEGGLSRLKNGRIATLSSRNGLPCDSTHWVMEDNTHSVWLYTTCGLVRVARSELDAWAASVDVGAMDAKPTIHATVFDSFDGVRTLEDNGGYTPHVAKASDGKLWFLPSDGASVVDPHHLPFNRLPPPVHIEQITADRKTYLPDPGGSGHLRLPPLLQNLEIDYTALSLVAPEKVLFRYKLENWDRDWEEAGTRRQAFYTHLSPGNYRFRVAACNNSGIWNDTGAALDFAVAPAYYQAAWFRLSSVAAVLALLAILYQLRLRQAARYFNIRMEERVHERTRIARDLHDTLLQSFQGVLLKFNAVTYALPDHPAEAKRTLNSAIDEARQAIAEGRDAVQGLRSSTVVTNDLARAIGTFGEGLAADQNGGISSDFRVHVEGTPRELVPSLRNEVYRIAVEALRNAFRHADAKRIEVDIGYDKRQFRMNVRDNGRVSTHRFWMKAAAPRITACLVCRNAPNWWGLNWLFGVNPILVPRSS